MADQKTSIVITAEDKTQAALATVRNGFAGLTQSMNGLDSLAGKIPLLAGALGGVSFTGLIKGSIDAMAALDDMSEKTGATVESLSAISEVAKIGGHDLGQVESMMIRLTKALAGGDDEAKAAGHALESLGLSAAKLRGMETGTATLEIAKALDKYADSGGKSALVTDLLGKAGAQALPFLKDLAEKGELNAKVTTEQAAEAEKLQKSWNRLQVIFEDSTRTLAIGLLPAMTDLTKALAGGIVDGFVTRWGAAFKGLAAGIIETSATVEEFLGKITFGKVAENHFRQAIAFRDAAKKIYAELSAMAPAGAPSNVSGAAKASLAGYTTAKKGSSGKSDLQKMLDKGQQNQLDDYYKYGGEESMYEAARKNSELSAQTAKKATDEQERLVQKYKDLADPLQQYRTQLDEINTLRAAGLLTTDQAIASEWAVNEAMDAQVDKMNKLGVEADKTNNIARDLGMTFTSAFEDAIVSGKSFGDVLKGLGDDIARIITRKTITEPIGDAISGMAKSFDWKSLFKFNADGGVYNSPSLSAFSGGIYDSPRLFKFASGAGVFGEAGPEAIMPLKRGSDGKLGVQSNGGGVNIVVNNTAAPDVQATATARRNDGGFDIEVIVQRAIAKDMSRNGPITQSFGSMFGLGRAV